jgi:hypothetical protein
VAINASGQAAGYARDSNGGSVGLLFNAGGGANAFG